MSKYVYNNQFNAVAAEHATLTIVQHISTRTYAYAYEPGFFPPGKNHSAEKTTRPQRAKKRLSRENN